MATDITVRQSSGSRGSGIVVIRSDVTGGLLLNTSGAVEGANSVGETVVSMTIAHIAWTGEWTIKRGDDTVFSTPTGSWGQYDFADEQLKLEIPAQETANVVFAAGAGANSIIIKMHKRSGAS
jgi:hypothetical protein